MKQAYNLYQSSKTNQQPINQAKENKLNQTATHPQALKEQHKHN